MQHSRNSDRRMITCQAQPKRRARTRSSAAGCWQHPRIDHANPDCRSPGVMVAVPAAAKTYSAERFDSTHPNAPKRRHRSRRDRRLSFRGRQFTTSSARSRRRRTDDIEIISAEMDGRELPFGNGAGTGRSQRIGRRCASRWRFAPRADSTHTFVLKYVVSGVVQRQAGHDVLDWVALPTEHDYRIDRERGHPRAAGGADSCDRQSTRSASPRRRPRAGRPARSNPRARHRQERVGEDAGGVRAGCDHRRRAGVAAAPPYCACARASMDDRGGPGLRRRPGVPVRAPPAIRQPSRHRQHRGTVETPPDTLRPGVAGAVASNGGVTLQHAMATLFALADRGVVTIAEEPRKWGQRNFTLHRRPGANQPLAPEEMAVLNLAFRNKGPKRLQFP